MPDNKPAQIPTYLREGKRFGKRAGDYETAWQDCRKPTLKHLQRLSMPDAFWNTPSCQMITKIRSRLAKQESVLMLEKKARMKVL